MIGLIILILAIIIVVWAIVGYNSLVKAKNNVEEGYSTMDVYLKKRFDLVPNLVETVKGYAKHESETLEKVMEARAKVNSAATREEKLGGEQALSSCLKNLFAVGEAYPDLKANANYLNLQNQLKDIENDIANARKYYNAVVKQLNNKCEMFPSNILAGIFKFSKQPMFSVDDTERQNVEVKF